MTSLHRKYNTNTISRSGVCYETEIPFFPRYPQAGNQVMTGRTMLEIEKENQLRRLNVLFCNENLC